MTKEMKLALEQAEREEKARNEVSYEIEGNWLHTNEDESKVVRLLLELHRKVFEYGQQGNPQAERHLRRLIGMLTDTFDGYIDLKKKGEL